MRILAAAKSASILLFVAASGLPDPNVAAQPTAPTSDRAAVKPAPLPADTSTQTVLGNTFIAPAAWTVTVRPPATILEAPEGDSWIALVDLAKADHADVSKKGNRES